MGTSSRGQAARRQSGMIAPTTGSTSTPTKASAHTRWRSAAADRRSSNDAPAANRRMTVAFTKASASIVIMSTALLARIRDEYAQPVELGFRQSRRGEIEERGDRLLRRSVKKRVQQLAQRRLPRAFPRDRRDKHVARAV